MYYKLDGHRAVRCSNAEWFEWFAIADHRVAETWIDDIQVSTVFLGIDHNAFPHADPALFETMVFSDDELHPVRRYFIWEEAEAGHAEMVAMIHTEMKSAAARAALAWERVYERLKA
ncbi:hypothetical protein [Pseudomonas veronii]|uniref:hypothetical protein n=1 Tax=Pseudomonas veronii TaxID=76761 RepID=UPI0006257DC6|nr:hypothetical protein [Pseudomonas veronii]